MNDKKRETIKKIESYIEENYSEKRRVHTYGVLKAANELMKSNPGFEISDPELPDKITISVLFHDMFRGTPECEIDRLLDEFGIGEIDGHIYKGNANLAHGKIASMVMAMEWGITDRDILNAVSYHTTGRAGMSILERVLFLADAIEDGRDYSGVDEIRAEAHKSLDRGCLAALKNTVEYLNNEGVHIDRDTLDALKYFEKENNIEQ